MATGVGSGLDLVEFGSWGFLFPPFLFFLEAEEDLSDDLTRSGSPSESMLAAIAACWSSCSRGATVFTLDGAFLAPPPLLRGQGGGATNVDGFFLFLFFFEVGVGR